MAADAIPGVTLEGELGRGSSSIVYRATLEGRPCAVKVPTVRGRWTRWIYREAVALARVHHPALPRVIEVGQVDDLPFLVLELVSGESLADRLARGRMGEPQVVELASELASALAAVHEVGLVHRDVKPRNIVVEASGRIRLVDFGFAMGLERMGRDASAAGTPLYAAPEQRRSPSRVDGRADLYALGLVMLEALVGSLPVSRAPKAIAEALEGRASRELAAVIVELVAEAPEDRFRDAPELLEALSRVRGQAIARARETSKPRAVLPGRVKELERLVREWREAPTRGGSLVCVEGPRGTGKTRLLGAAAEAVRHLASGHAAEATCLEGDPPLALVRRLVEGLVADLRTEQPDEAALRGLLESNVRAELKPFARLVAPSLAALLETSDAQHDAGNDAFGEATADLIAALIKLRSPLLLAIDDIHWIDALSRRVLVALADQVAQLPLALVLGARPDHRGVTYDAIVAAARGRASALELAPLDGAAVGQILTAHLGLAPPHGLVERVASLADATPLGVLEVLETYLDTGALRPRAGEWVFDEDRASLTALPEGTASLLRRRVEELPSATRRVMEAAAVHANTWDEPLLAAVFAVTVEDMGFAVADARRAKLVAIARSGRVHFVHDAVRATLLSGIEAPALADLHQRLADVLQTMGRPDFESLCATARHYGAGIVERSPEKAYWTQRSAADASLARSANEDALEFLALARRSAAAGRIALDERFHAAAGEANLRLGNLEASRAAFEEALAFAVSPEARARLLGRLAWVDQSRSEPVLAWRSLARAFELLGEQIPGEKVSSVLGTVRAFAPKRLQRARPQKPAVTELLCQLHYQNARLGIEYGKPARLLQSTIQALAVSRSLGESPALARSRATLGLLYAAVGRAEAARRAVDEADRMAARLDDRASLAFCAQARAIASSLLAEGDRSLQLVEQCLAEHGLWLDLAEACLLASTADLLETMRGHAAASLSWASRAYDRVRRRQRSDGATPLILLRMRAALAAVGRDDTEDALLSAKLAAIDPATFTKGWMGMLTWGPRARYLVERGEVGAPLEELLAGFRKLAIDPRRAHVAIVEFFQAVIDARIYQSVRAPDHERSLHAARLREAIEDLRRAPPLPTTNAHMLAARAHAAWLEGKRPEEVEELLALAERAARDVDAPAVLYAVARTRAHALARSGALGAARDQARAAEALARSHGAVVRARWIAEELSLAPLVTADVSSSSRSAAESSRGQLRSLVTLARAPRRDATLAEQAVLVAEEVVRVLRAERCFLLFRADARTGEVVVGVDAGGIVSRVPETDRALLEEVGLSGIAVETLRGSGDPGFVVTPLRLFERVVGALGVECAAESTGFDAAARGALSALATQVPVALELARLLAEREQLQASLVQAQRMEAVGQLAGGIAHDFNNMLAAILASVDALEGMVPEDDAAREELGVIREAAARAADLTKRLLSFSRHRPLPLERVDTQQLLTGLAPMIQRIVGERVRISLELEASAPPIRSDPTAIEQAIVNLATNARDAMGKRGRLTLRTRAVELDAEAVRRGAPAPGSYVAIDVIDSGEGMAREIVERIFDPFFSTKPTSAGTGLGLTMVYTFVKRSGGHIEVTSTPGAGTTMSLYFPRDDAEPATTEAAPASAAAPRASLAPKSETILVVDDDPLVRSSIQRALRRRGYDVLVAESGEEAASLVRERADRIALVILDVLMPGLTGPELERQWAVELESPPKVLFVSGFSPETLPTPDAGRVARSTFLQKPFSNAELLSRVERILAEETRASAE